MPYKIYTYADPYKIYETDFWSEIKEYPQLCASRTLVNGILSVMGNEIVSLVCPVDDIVEKRLFREWANNISLRIQQYSELGDLLDKWHKDTHNPMPDNYYDAFVKNKGEMLDSIRLLVELGIKSDSLNAKKLNMEHKVFVYLLRILEKRNLFSLPQLPSLEGIKEQFILQSCFEKEEKARLHEGKKEDEFYTKEIEIINRMIESMKSWDGKHLVVHGIHQFTPLQLRFITYLESLGAEIIFLYNYLQEFNEIYSSWNYIYQQFDAPIHHDSVITTYIPEGQLQTPGNAMATNMALLCEEKMHLGDKRIQENYKLYKNEYIYTFDNISEYAGYVSDLFAKAERKTNDNNNNSFVKTKEGTAAVLARMEDVIYTANKDVDDLLQVYHPQYARNRHFLAYPVGQFFVAIYGLWNADNNEINIDYNLLRNCVNSGILTEYNAEQLLKTMMNLEPLFSYVDSYSEFDNEYTVYLQSYDRVNHSVDGSIAYPLRNINIYNEYKVPRDDAAALYSAIREINDVAKSLFGFTRENERFQFEVHFSRLKDFVSSKQSSMADEEEKELISKLISRLDTVKEQLKEDHRKGTMDDLRSGLYYFLKQKEEPVSDWFVKNFEQIDGDILNSKKQNSPGRKKVYHFACVSDKDMNCKVNELLPWPLSEEFIEKAYNPKELPFQVYYAALGERSNFMRYALFYGLYFCQCETKLSFVKRYGDNTTDYYELLRLIGLRSEDGAIRSKDVDYPLAITAKGQKIYNVKYDREQMVAMLYCPYRYLLDYVLNPTPIASGMFLIQRFYVNLLIENTWKSIQGKNPSIVRDKLSNIIDQEASKLEGFFPFFRETEFLDMKRQVENYLVVSSNILNGQFDYNPSHMALRQKFGMAKFYDEAQNLPQKHQYDSFEQLAKFQDGKKSYSAHDIPKTESEDLLKCVLDYINNSDKKMARAGSWCAFCVNKNLCLQPFAEGRG